MAAVGLFDRVMQSYTRIISQELMHMMRFYRIYIQLDRSLMVSDSESLRKLALLRFGRTIIRTSFPPCSH